MRLSAIGDISHMLPIIHTLQSNWPKCKITWIIGKVEHSMVYDLPNINFIVFDKAKKWHAYKDIKQALKGQRFDVLLHMQMSLRSSIASLLVKAPIKVGFDVKRAHDFQWLFTNKKIPHTPRQHVIESFFSFIELLGIKNKQWRWDIPIADKDIEWAKHRVKLDDKKTLVIAPCSSKSYRNWAKEGYQDIAAYALENNLSVVIVGGDSELEHEFANAIQDECQQQCVNLTGKTNLKQLLAVISLCDVVLAPDSGPAHLGTACGKPVIGLYACTNPDRARPYMSADYVVNEYPQAVLDKHDQYVEQLPWGIRIRDKGTMERITFEQVQQQLDKFILKES